MEPSKLKKIMAFRFLKDDELETLSQSCETLCLKDKDVLLDEHEVSPYIYFIIEGGVNVMVENNDHSKAYITLLGEGESFGESGIFPQLERNATITGAMDSTVVRIHRQALLDFISKHTTAGIKFLMMIIHGLLTKLRSLNRELAFERKTNSGQMDIDSLVQDFMKQLA